jgi:membrane-bound lytic murein transglycosylase F
MKLLLATLATLLLGSCAQPPSWLERIYVAGELRVVTRNSPDAYYLGREGPLGPAYELARGFAEDLGLPLRLYTVRTREAALAEVAAGRAHLAAAGLSTDTPVPAGVRFAGGYQRVREHLVKRRRAPQPRSFASVVRGGHIEVVAGSAHQRTLEQLRLAHPDLTWVERSDSDTEEILAEVARDQVQYTLATSTEFALGRTIYPELSVALDLSPVRAVAWAVASDGGDRSLLGRVEAYFAAARQSGIVAAVLQRYYGERNRFDYLLSRNLMRHVEERLPTYRRWFEEAGELHSVDWLLLAAMGYQESKWDPRAVSFTGVRGLMQLTRDTAEFVRAGDREDPRSSIFGGAKYLARLLRSVPARIPEPDRTWLAVAAYNVGYGHVEDARVLAQRAGRNPDRWEDVRRHLPLLSQERWYTRTRNGYARGWEPVRYVDNVRTYMGILEVAVARDPVPIDTSAAGLEEAPK